MTGVTNKKNAKNDRTPVPNQQKDDPIIVKCTVPKQR